MRFDKTGFKDKCDKQEFEKSIDQSNIQKLIDNFELIIDLQKFHNMCYKINSVLSRYNYFLGVFELKNKYRRFSMKDKSKKKIVRQLSSCLIEKYSGFRLISIEHEKNQRKLFKPIDIIYKSTKSIEIEPLYLISYQDNFHAKGNVPFVVYFDFETTAPVDNYLDPEQKKMFAISYVMIVAFNAELNLDRIIIQRSFAHSVEQLSSLDYFTPEQITCIDQSLIKMLNGVAFEVSKRRCKNSIGQMFSIESALVKKTLLKWFHQKFKQQFDKIDPFQKIKYERQHSIDWENYKCVMSFGDFVIRFEHKFLRNIYTIEQIQDSGHLKNIERYYPIFMEYIMICIGLLALLNNYHKGDYINYATEEFVQNNFTGDEITDIKNTINQTEIKNALQKTDGNVSKFNLKIYAYVYDQLVYFPRSDIDYETITTNKFFMNVHRLIRGKFHLHHSHITGRIYGYAHDFCNTTQMERSTAEIPFIAHNFFGFDLFYYLKAYIP